MSAYWNKVLKVYLAVNNKKLKIFHNMERMQKAQTTHSNIVSGNQRLVWFLVFQAPYILLVLRFRLLDHLFIVKCNVYMCIMCTVVLILKSDLDPVLASLWICFCLLLLLFLFIFLFLLIFRWFFTVTVYISGASHKVPPLPQFPESSEFSVRLPHTGDSSHAAYYLLAYSHVRVEKLLGDRIITEY